MSFWGRAGETLFIFAAFLVAASADAGSRIRIASYNMENFQSPEHAEGKDDWAFTPKGTPGKEENCRQLTPEWRKKECLETDWTWNKVRLKMANIHRAVDVMGARPDLFAGIEISGTDIAELIRKDLGYDGFKMTNSPDHRGMDVALFFKESNKLRFRKSEEIDISSVINGGASRNILEVQFELEDGTPLFVYVNHWPSQHHPAADRMRVAEVLAKRINDRTSENPKAQFTCLGDFNVVEGDAPFPFKPLVARTGMVQPPMVDVEKRFRLKARGPATTRVDLYATKQGTVWEKSMPPASNFYPPDLEWSSLDHIFVSRNFIENGTWRLDSTSFRIISAPFMTTDFVVDCGRYLSGSIMKGIPKRMNTAGHTADELGFSDHFPVMFEIEYAPNGIGASH